MRGIAVVTIAYIGTREECRRALTKADREGVWDDTRNQVLRGKLVGKPKYERHEDHWHVEQDFAPR